MAFPRNAPSGALRPKFQLDFVFACVCKDGTVVGSAKSWLRWSLGSVKKRTLIYLRRLRSVSANGRCWCELVRGSVLVIVHDRCPRFSAQTPRLIDLRCSIDEYKAAHKATGVTEYSIGSYPGKYDKIPCFDCHTRGLRMFKYCDWSCPDVST
jgi:hypothetical protein